MHVISRCHELVGSVVLEYILTRVVFSNITPQAVFTRNLNIDVDVFDVEINPLQLCASNTSNLGFDIDIDM